MTQVNATINLDSKSDDSNLLHRLSEIQNVGDEIQNHTDSLSDMGYEVQFKSEGGELAIKVQPQ